MDFIIWFNYICFIFNHCSRPGCVEYSFHQKAISYTSDETVFAKHLGKLGFSVFAATLNIREKTMVTSDEEAEYTIYDLFSDVGGRFHK